MVRILVSYVISTNFGRKLAGNFRNIISAHCFLYSTFSGQIEYGEWCPRMKMIILYVCLKPVSSWRAGAVDWGLFIESPCYFQTRVTSYAPSSAHGDFIYLRECIRIAFILCLNSILLWMFVLIILFSTIA
jgi:hypothetical protein